MKLAIVIGDNIRKLRAKRKISRDAMALDLKKNVSSVQAWEDGVNEPSASSLVELADYFSVSVDELLGR